MKIKQAWKLPAVFLIGYLFAWGMILVDRQMLIQEQRQLQDEINSIRIELKVTTMIDDYNDDYREQVEWNRKALFSPKPKEVGR